MAQNSVNYADNPTGPQLLDNYLTKEQENILSSNSGIQRPSYAVGGTTWLDTSVTPWLYKIYDGSSDVVIGEVNPTAHSFIAQGVDESNLVHKTGNETIAGTKSFSSTISGSINGNAATVTNGVYSTGNQTINGTKTFSSSPLVPTPNNNDNSTKAVNTKWIRDNTQTVHVVVDTYENEYGDWYRLYDDDWVEQGGIAEVTANGTLTIDLLYEFLNTNYIAFKNYASSGSGSTEDWQVSIFNKTTTTFDVSNALADTSAIEWIAFGKGKGPLV